MDHQPMYNWSIRHLPTLSAVICTFPALDLDIYVHLDFRHISPRQRSSIWWSAIFLHVIITQIFWICMYILTHTCNSFCISLNIIDIWSSYLINIVTRFLLFISTSGLTRWEDKGVHGKRTGIPYISLWNNWNWRVITFLLTNTFSNLIFGFVFILTSAVISEVINSAGLLRQKYL